MQTARAFGRKAADAAFGCLLAAAASLAPTTARAGDRETACSAAFSNGPRLIKEGKFLEARAQLTSCAAAPCPDSMRPLCAEDLRSLEARIPSVVFVAKNAHGGDLVDVRVVENGRVLAERLDGKSVPLDPGVHTFDFERGGHSAVHVQVLVREGEAARPITAAFPDAQPLASAPPPSSPSADAAPRRPVPWTVYVAGGVTVLAGASFGFFGVRGLSERSDLASCKGACDHDAVSHARNDFTVADVSLAVGVVALAATAVLFFTRPDEPALAAARGTVAF